MTEIRKQPRGGVRKTYIDFVKIIAIFLVMFNHTGEKGFVLFTIRQDSPFFWFYLFNGIFTLVDVPLFFMSSGALLLNKEEPIKQLVKKRFTRFLIVLVVCSAGQYLYTCYNNSSLVPSFTDFFTKLYTNTMATGYWYLYTYLGYILMLPFLRCLAKSMKEKHYLWMFFLFGLISMLPIIDFLIWQGSKSYNGSFRFFIATNYVFYPLMGYYIDSVMQNKWFNLKILSILSVASVVSIVVCCLMTQYKCTLIGEWKEGSCQTFFNTLSFLPAVTIFYAMKMLFLRHSPSRKICKTIEVIGGTTFGIFLCENILRWRTVGIFKFLEPHITSLPACWIWILCACTIGVIITLIIKIIPGVKKFI